MIRKAERPLSSRNLRRQLARSNRRVQLARLRKALGDLAAGLFVRAAYAVARTLDRWRYGR